MNDLVSVFDGIKPSVMDETYWPLVLEDIQTGVYRERIAKGRTIKNPDAYREYKKTLPAVTFSAAFDRTRNKQSVKHATGFLLPDLDHLEDLESVFQTIVHDENIWFVFRTPSGTGLKCGLRAEGISTDDDIKRFFAACSRYFMDTYDLKLDPACKDISRLTFVSYDPKLFVNPNPSLFDVDAWTCKAKPEPFYMPSDTNNGWKGKYGQKVIESCCREIAESARGQQHNTRLRMARVIGGFVASGYVDEGDALNALEQAVRASGAVLIEQAMKTVRDGIENGKASPIYPKERQMQSKADIMYSMDDNDYVDDNDDNDDTCPQRRHLTTNDDICPHVDDSMTTDDDQKDPKSPSGKVFNLASVIREWIENSSGSFSVDQLDRDLGLTTRMEKQHRSKCLSRYIEKKLIIRDKRSAGRYQIIDTKLDVIDLFAVDETPFQLKLPFDLHEYVVIPRKAIIVIAGSSNAGKTALMMNILQMNLQQKYPLMYLMSEMGPGEYKNRVRGLEDIDLKLWSERVKASERPSDFNGAIEHHNRDGLTCIDFLEEIDGEYYKMASDIRNIYDALGNGVAIISIQKKTTEEYARGGQATAEKARLYLTVDKIKDEEHSVICSLKIIKLKHYKTKNMQGHETFFEISRGTHITQLDDWKPASQSNRSKFLANLDGRDYVYSFKTRSGRVVGVNSKNYQKWVENYDDRRLDSVVQKISSDSFSHGFLKDKDWLYQVHGIIRKELDAEG